jgi:hypothetical protein
MNAAVFAVGVARSQGYMSPPDYVFVALVLIASTVSAATLLLGMYSPLRDEAGATLVSAAYLLNVCLLGFVIFLLGVLPDVAREQQRLWIGILGIAPIVNAVAMPLCRKRQR